jgi:hypothetical protein
MTKAKLYFTDTDSQEINDLESQNLNVSGNSTFGNIYSVGIITATQINGNIIGVSTLSVGYASTAGISTYADAAGISTISQGLTGTPNIIVGIITASTYVATGTTDVYAAVGVSTVDSNTTAFHYVTYNTNSTAVNISNFSSGKTFNVVSRNTGGGGRTLIIRTSTTESGHAIVPTIVHSGGTITNGTINISSGAGLLISIFNMNGTIVGHYG